MAGYTPQKRSIFNRIRDGVVYPLDASVGRFPEALVLEVADYCGPAFYPSEPKWVPILPKVSMKAGTRQTREQFPVIAGYVLTVNKVQGLTIREGVVIATTGIRRRCSRRTLQPQASHAVTGHLEEQTSDRHLATVRTIISLFFLL